MLDDEAIHRLLAFLPAFEQGAFVSAHSHYCATGDYLPAVAELMGTIYDSGLVQPAFNWIAWKNEAMRYSGDLELIAQADLETIRRLFTIAVRQDRFVGGLMPGLCASGFIEALLKRLGSLCSAATSSETV